MRIIELVSGTGFALTDTNGYQRLSANNVQTLIQDGSNKIAFFADANNRVVYSPDLKNYIVVTNSTIQVVKDGVVKASW